jgi:hypothetical protein
VARLEVRLLDDRERWTLLSAYDPITLDEVSLRFACDYLVRGNKVYETVYSAWEDGMYAVYVRHSSDEQVAESGLVFQPDWEGIRVELRRFHEDWDRYPVVHRFHFHDAREALLALSSRFFRFGEEDWEKTSAEVDENRKVYVIYAKPVRE